MLDKTFDAAIQEPALYKLWEDSGVFQPQEATEDNEAPEPFCIVIPPPNVTGSLHIGHALNSTLQDVLCRFERMRGKSVLWQPGTDHAGIATQTLVERQLSSQGQPSRIELGRDEFQKRVWEWKEHSGNTILNQLRRLGSSCDWSRTRFTLDEGLSKAVRTVFIRLWQDGLIYRDKRLVNWDPGIKTAISDLETIPTEVDTSLWHIKYAVISQPGTFIEVATTRPETLLGDTAIAVHPEDDRYRHLIGELVRIPLVERDVPIVGDTHADPEIGSGAVKITPAHDFNDFEVGKRHSLDQITVMDEAGCMNENAPERFRGMDRFEARKKIVAELEELDQLVRVEKYRTTIPYGDRSGVPVEPRLTDQWYCNVTPLAEVAIKAVKDKRTVFTPESWNKTYFDWLENVQPWCISRQLWWGHRIPIWYGPDGRDFAAESECEAKKLASKHYGKDVDLIQDPDVLDTWFSSALWPFSTLGWPEKTPELEKFYPTATLVTAFDIIFFWVARMMMIGLYCMPEVPFHKVYIHALVRDAHGKKMSKSKGNIIDPLEMIDRYGADGLRLALTSMAAQGRDIRLSEQSVAGYRNFSTKLWNAARLCEMNGCSIRETMPASISYPFNRWVTCELQSVISSITDSLVHFRFNEAAGDLYRFVWHVFCDWYLEIAKQVWKKADENNASSDAVAQAHEVREVAGWLINQVLRLGAPFIPFVTEKIWQQLHNNESLLARQRWPELSEHQIEKAPDADLTIGLVKAIRSIRAALRISPGARITLEVKDGDHNELAQAAMRHKPILLRLAHLGDVVSCQEFSKARAIVIVNEHQAAIPIDEHVDINAEVERLSSQISDLENELSRISSRLSNEGFIKRAREEIVDEHRARQKNLRDEIEAIKDTMSLLSAGE